MQERIKEDSVIGLDMDTHQKIMTASPNRYCTTVDAEMPQRKRVTADHSVLKDLESGEQWRSQKFWTRGALINGFPSYPHNPLPIYLIHYVTKYFSEK